MNIINQAIDTAIKLAENGEIAGFSPLVFYYNDFKHVGKGLGFIKIINKWIKKLLSKYNIKERSIRRNLSNLKNQITNIDTNVSKYFEEAINPITMQW